MSEYIVKCKKFTGITGNELEFPEYIDTNKEIVRCMDCIYFDNDTNHGAHCWKFGNALWDDYDGFCAWGERRTNE